MNPTMKSFVAFALSGLCLSCSNDETSETHPNPEPATAKVRVFKDGRLTLNDNVVTIAELQAEFRRLRENEGRVLYYRETAQEEPPAIAAQVVQAVIDAKLPIQLSSKPDFSDAVGADGISRPK